MTKQVQLRRGTSLEHETFTGALSELTVDTTNKELRLHDGVTQGGIRVTPTGKDFDQIPLNADIVYPVATVADMLALPDINPGQLITVSDYAQGNNSGVLFFKSFAGAAPSPDGGSQIDHDTLPIHFVQNFPKDIYIEMFGGKGDGVSDSTQAFNSISSYTDRVNFGVGTYLISGATTNKALHLLGTSTGETTIKNFTDGGTILTLDQSGVSDKERRNWCYVADMTIRDSLTETGYGIVFDSVLSIVFDRVYVRDFAAGRGLDIKESLWTYLNYVNTDRSEVALTSTLTPHFNNNVSIVGGEYRNPTNGRSTLFIENSDVISIRDAAIEGDAGGTSYVSGALLRNVQQLRIDNTYFEVLPNATEAALALDNVTSAIITTGLVNSQLTSTPSVKMTNGTKRVSFNGVRSSGGAISADSSVGAITFDGCAIGSQLDIADGVNYTIRKTGPVTAITIPINPNYQPDNTHSDIAFKNWFHDSSFESRALTVTNLVGLPVTSQSIVDGYYDNFSTSIDGVSGDKVRTETLGTSDAIGDRVCVTFMAKASIVSEFTFTVFADGAKGGSTATVQEDWRRYFVFGIDAGVTVAESSILMDIEFGSSSTLMIDDLQTVAFSNYADATDLIDNFRYISTNGDRVTLKTSNRSVPYVPYFEHGVRLKKRKSAPTTPLDGQVYYADGVVWNPGAGKGLYFYDGVFNKL